jgi:hypothetical protein
MKTDPQQSTNGRVYVEGTVVQAREEIARKREGGVRPLTALIALGIGLLIVGRLMRGEDG